MAEAATPSPSHLPVMWTQVMEGLRVLKDGRYLDGTFGRGGHARGVLDRLGPEGKLLLMDKDPVAIAHAAEMFGADARVAVYRGSFAAVPRRMSDPAAVTETVVVPPAVVMEPVWETAPPAMRARSWPTDDGPITSALASVTATLLAPLLFRLTAPVKSLAASVSVMGLAPASKAAVPPTVRPAAWERAPEAVRSRLPVVDPWMASAPVSLRKTLPPVLLRMRV